MKHPAHAHTRKSLAQLEQERVERIVVENRVRQAFQTREERIETGRKAPAELWPE